MATMLELRPNCELCDRRPATRLGRRPHLLVRVHVLRRCVEDVLHDVCPNCGGGFQPRPIRPAKAHRKGTGLVNDPPEARRRHTRYTREEIESFGATLRDVPPTER